MDSDSPPVVAEPLAAEASGADAIRFPRLAELAASETVRRTLALVLHGLSDTGFTRSSQGALRCIMLTIQMLLASWGCELRRVRLLRHTPKSGVPGIPPYQAWRERRDLFEDYQRTQPARDRRFFDVDHWASFVATPDRQTLFTGLYAVKLQDREIDAFTCPLTAVDQPAGRVDRYSTQLEDASAEYVGKLFVDWGLGTRSWAQHADRNIKPIVELRRDQSEPAYPGHSALVMQLSQVSTLPASWRAVLASARGVYLLTCPKTKQQYVGAAFSESGFLSRWEQHERMQGDAIEFRSRDPADYRVSILEVAGSLATDLDIAIMEQRWKEKLQSREMGLNRN